ncbi:MAG: MucR family transcriptional regulator [Syntrophobacteraceae bacterium]
MPDYPRPKSSMPKKPTKSSLHPHGPPGFSETVEGLKRNLAKLGTHLAGAAMGMAGNLTSALQNLKKSAGEGDENSERAYEEALSMLRSSGSSTADSLLRDLGEELGEEPEAFEQKDAEGLGSEASGTETVEEAAPAADETISEMRGSEAATQDLKSPVEFGRSENDATSEMQSPESEASGMETVEESTQTDSEIVSDPEMKGDESAVSDRKPTERAGEPKEQASMRVGLTGEVLTEGAMEEKSELRPEDSIQANAVICLECGKQFKQITHTHLSSHGLSPEEYKDKYELPRETPLSAKAMVRERKPKKSE